MALDVNEKPIGLTNEDWDRIAKLANKPGWERSNSDLLPE
jgi:hypothetical protein